MPQNPLDSAEQGQSRPSDATEKQGGLCREFSQIPDGERTRALRDYQQRVPDTSGSYLPQVTLAGNRSDSAADDGAGALEGQGEQTQAVQAKHASPNTPALFYSTMGWLDTNEDGFASAEEIDRAAANQCFSEHEARLVEFMQQHREQLEELSDDELFDEDSGITLYDMIALDQAGRAVASARELSERGLANFAALDGNSDGYLSRDELNEAAHERCERTPNFRSTAKDLGEQWFRDLIRVSNDEFGPEEEISRSDLQGFPREIMNDLEAEMLSDADAVLNGYQCDVTGPCLVPAEFRPPVPGVIESQ
jgi:hypothetical protein